MSRKLLSKTAAWLILLLASLFLAITGCEIPNPYFIWVASIEGVPQTGETGTPLTLTGTIRPAFASNKDIVWSVKDAGTTGASISGNILNANTEGTIKIRAKISNGTAEGKDYTQDFEIVFSEGVGSGGEHVSVTGVTLNKTTLTMTVGSTATLTATVTPSNASNKTVTWSSNEMGVATVSNGVVTAHAADTVTITVTTEDGGFTASCLVTINKAAGARVTVPTVSGSPTSDSIIVNPVSLQTATGQSIEYAILTVSNGNPTSWQNSTTFTGLTSDTTYYVYARSAADYYHYEAGTPSVSAGIATAGGGGSITSPTGIEMVTIPAGTFTMGQADISLATPVHSVTLTKSFYMGKYLVTQALYQLVMESNPSNFTSAVSGESGTPGKLPVEMVSWYDALVFCNKLSAMEGLSPAYSISGSTDPATWGSVPPYIDTTWNTVVIVAGSTGYRLPTEAQWEYACRAGTTTAYNTGDTISDNTGWYSSNSGSKTHEVGLKPANAWGLYDMHGNVYELCWDRYGSYPSEAQTDPMGESSGTGRGYRGGSWNSSAGDLRSAIRYYDSPYVRKVTLGFRLVRP